MKIVTENITDIENVSMIVDRATEDIKNKFTINVAQYLKDDLPIKIKD